MPQRIQMTRQRPWRADNPDAVIVARPTKWGNPNRIEDYRRVRYDMDGEPYRNSVETARRYAVKVETRFFGAGDHEMTVTFYGGRLMAAHRKETP